MGSLQHLEKAISSRVAVRGRDYFVQDRVTIEEAEQAAITATVRGSRDYVVDLRIERGDLFGRCECVYYVDRTEVCKHIWATFLSAVDAQLIDPATIRGIFPDEEEFEGESATVVPFRREPEWASFFTQLRFAAAADVGPSRRPADRHDEMIYVVEAHGGYAQQLAVELHGRSRKKSGEWKMSRKLAPSQALAIAPPEERELVAILTNAAPRFSSGAHSEAFQLSASAADFLLPRLARTGRLYLRLRNETLVGPLRPLGEELRFEVQVDGAGEKYRMEGFFVRGGERVPLREALLIASDAWLFTRNFVARFDVAKGKRWLQQLRTRGAVEVPREDAERFAELLAAAPAGPLVVPNELQPADITPRPLLKLEREYADSWKARLLMLYGEAAVPPSDSGGVRIGESVVRRRADIEEAAIRTLDMLPFRTSSVDVRHLHDQHLVSVVRTLAEDGWSIEFGDQRAEVEGHLEFEVSSGIDWFDLEGGASFGGKFVPLPQLLAAVRKQQPVVALEGGGVAVLPKEWESRLTALSEAASEHEDGLRFTRSQVTVLDALLAARDEAQFDRDFEALRERLASTTVIEETREPEGFSGELRPYQRLGLGWLHFLRDIGFGGILADDMGLGKTVQVLALLEEIRQEKGEKRRTSLVVAPRSLMFNWKAEAARFAPELRVLDHHGIERIKGSEHFDDYDVILTTYGTLQRDLADLANPEFEYVILDEAQAIKNADSQTARSVRALRARHRLALSGTPIENHLGELWSLFEFLNPGMLGTRRAFSRGFGAKSAPPEGREKLAKIVRPFVLRRTKEMVLDDLPPKNEQTLWVELSPESRREYDELREHYRRALLERIDRDGMGKSRMFVLEALLRLRQAACHPALIDPTRRHDVSAKTEALDAELSVVLDSGHKAIVFSQFTSFLDVIEQRVQEQQVRYVRLDGSSRNREELVRQFQEEPTVKLFLVSLRAGGVGLNLTAADYVFLLDPWWNPAAESQAIDRAHRIGQKRTVFAYRIVARDTVEEKILELQERKRDLAESIIRADEGPLGELDLSDLERLLS